MGTETIQVEAAKLHEALVAVYTQHGVSAEEAETVSRHQVEANLTGHDSHGAVRTPRYVAQIHKGDVVPGATFEVERESPTTAVINGNWGFGFVMTEQAMRLGIDKARESGLAGVTIRYQGHVGRLGKYAAMAAEAGFIALLTADSGRGPKLAAPFGGNTAKLGSNPICIGVPSAEHGPVILDMATTAVALGKVQLARARGESIPKGWIVDKDGEPTTDPEDYFRGGALLPLGGDQAHKGFGLSFMVEVLCGLLTGLGYGVAADGRHNDGNFIALYDVGAFRDREAFAGEVSDFVRFLKADAPEGSEVLFPGEAEQRTAERRRREGIPLETTTWEQLLELRNG